MLGLCSSSFGGRLESLCWRYGRFKDNIKNANELEAKTKKHYEENMAKYKQRKAAHKDDHVHFEKFRYF